MKSVNLSKRLMAALACIALLVGQLSPAQASMVSTTEALAQERLSVDRALLAEMIDREGVTQQMLALGVEPEAAKARVAAMTDEEIRQLNQHLAEMPAGGDALGVLLLLFVVFVITDMLGATDIFPFIHPINN